MRHAIIAVALMLCSAAHAQSSKVGDGHRQQNMMILAESGATCVLARGGQVLATAALPPRTDLPRGLSDTITLDLEGSHAPITVTCFARGYRTTSLTVVYGPQQYSVSTPLCVSVPNPTQQQRRESEACARDNHGGYGFIVMAYPEIVRIHLPPAH